MSNQLRGRGQIPNEEKLVSGLPVLQEWQEVRRGVIVGLAAAQYESYGREFDVLGQGIPCVAEPQSPYGSTSHWMAL